MQRRARQNRQRALIRGWEYRQRAHAKGVWTRLRRVLADAATAYVVPEDEAERLVSEGSCAEPVGAELEPSKTIVFVSAERAELIPGRRQVPVTLGPELLEARAWVLVRFP
jgi:hypothetical protein